MSEERRARIETKLRERLEAEHVELIDDALFCVVILLVVHRLLVFLLEIVLFLVSGGVNVGHNNII